MEQFVISKTFEFDYGHRVWTQMLDGELSCGAASVCRHLHGHRGSVNVYLSGNKLNEQGMVVDFQNLNWFKKFIDSEVDHKMILDINDPALKTLFPLFDLRPPVPYILKENMDSSGNTHPEVTFYFVDPFVILSQPVEISELYEGLILVDFVPTSENLAKWIFDIVQTKMTKLNVKVSHIEFFETPKSKSVYYGN